MADYFRQYVIVPYSKYRLDWFNDRPGDPTNIDDSLYDAAVCDYSFPVHNMP